MLSFKNKASSESQSMATLIVRNIDETIVRALKIRASQHGVSAEAEHRKILEQVLLKPQRKSFAELLSQIPNVGNDEDFERIQDDRASNVFD
jgi:antitoxin FitA